MKVKIDEDSTIAFGRKNSFHVGKNMIDIAVDMEATLFHSRLLKEHTQYT